MARTIPPERFTQLIEVATRIFIQRGYRLTQMADVAEGLGLAKGTVYGYVESKEALFDAAVRYADGHVPPPAPDKLPLRTPPSGATIKYIRSRLMAEATEMILVQVVDGRYPIQDPRTEISLIVSDLYRRVASNHRALKLIDRCALEYPELSEIWFVEGRWAQHGLLLQWLTSRMKKKRLRHLENPEIVARSILEMIAFWAMHRHFDPAPRQVSDAAAEHALIDMLVNGLVDGR